VIKFSNSIYSKYQLNITKFKTLSGLTLASYTSSYIPNNLTPDLKMVKGELEREIRTSYYGGNVDVYINEIDNGYYYDVNSQYPKAMLNDMPGGEPVLSLEKDINKIFGFVYGEITCPDEQTLQIPFIQCKDPLFKFNSCPRGKFRRLIFSEEIKYAIKFGYKIDVEYCYQFKRIKNLFTSYVKDHYEIKKSSEDPVQKSIAKLFLNSLYGRMGMKEIDNTMKIVNKKEAENLDKNANVTVFSELSDNKYLVKYSGKIVDNIRKLYKDNVLTSEINNFYNKNELRKSSLSKSRNIPSAVHIAAAISSYARIIINDYKNIPGNLCVMSDTDSVVLTKPLPDYLLGPELGQLRLEYEVAKGIFIRKNLYCIVDSKNKNIVKASGVDSSNLDLNSFINLLEGKSIEIERTSFNVE
jgi:hypothetical protein